MHLHELEKLSESDDAPPELREIIEALLQAVQDWPHDVDSLAAYADQVKKLLNTDRIDYDAIKKALSTLNPRDHAWELESLSSLLNVFEKHRAIEINGIVKMINK